MALIVPAQSMWGLGILPTIPFRGEIPGPELSVGLSRPSQVLLSESVAFIVKRHLSSTSYLTPIVHLTFASLDPFVATLRRENCHETYDTTMNIQLPEMVLRSSYCQIPELHVTDITTKKLFLQGVLDLPRKTINIESCNRAVRPLSDPRDNFQHGFHGRN